VKNQLHFLAMSQGICRQRKLWSTRGRAELEGLSLGPWASQPRKELLELLDSLGPRIEQLDQAVKTEAEQRREAVRLMEQKSVGPVTALAFVLTIGAIIEGPRLVVNPGMKSRRPQKRRSALPTLPGKLVGRRRTVCRQQPSARTGARRVRRS